MNDQNHILVPVSPPDHVKYTHKLGRGMLIPQQIRELVRAINPAYVETKQRLTYLAQHQARGEMNRIFGYGNWDSHVDDVFLIYETVQAGKDNKERWTVAYRARVTVNIRDLWGMPIATFSEYHAEENAPQPNRGEAHALALTSVESYALRRALIGLGDRFGLGLYDGGKTAAHGQYTIQQEPGVLYAPQVAQQVAPQPAQNPVENQPVAQAQPEQPAVTQFIGETVIPHIQQQGQQQAPQRSERMEQFSQVQQQMQADRQDARARLQQGLKQDDPQGGQ